MTLGGADNFGAADLRATNLGAAELGAKADGLVALRGAYPDLVPEFVVLPLASVLRDGAGWLERAQDAARRALDTNGTVTPSAHAGTSDDPDAVLSNIAAAAELDTAALAELLGPAASWPLVSVRTSALSEDGPDRSFAGLYVTHLDQAARDVAGAVLDCIRSLVSERVIAYARAAGIIELHVGGSVVVQRMVHGRIAGVMFTQTGKGTLDVAYSDVGPDAVVRGEVARRFAVRAVDPIPRRGPVPMRLLRIGRELQRAHGASDVEFAASGRRLWLLQVRPVTATDRTSTLAWDSSNIGENYPGVTLPLTYSFIRGVYAEVYPSFFRLLGRKEGQLRRQSHVFGNTLGYVFGRVHYQIDNWFHMAAMLPGGRANEDFFADMLRPVKRVDGDRKARPGPWGAVALGFAALRFAGVLATSERRSRRFRRDFERRYTRYAAIDFDGLSPDAALTTLAHVRTDLLALWAVPILNDVRLMIAHGLLLRSFGKGRNADYLAFMSGLTDRVSVAPLTALSTLGEELTGLGPQPELTDRGRAALEAYLDSFGGRAPDELQLENPRLGDDRAQLVALAAHAAAAPPRPEPTPPPRGTVIQRIIGAHVRRAIDHRERFRFNRAQVFGLARKAFLSAGAALARAGLLDDAHDVFWVTESELTDAVFGHSWSADLRPLVAQRKSMRGDYDAADPARRLVGSGDIAVASVHPDQALEDGDLAGQGVSPGRFTGEVLVLTEFDASADVRGKLLVTRHVDPGWTLLFVSAGGIITERGNALSHVAIIGRELGIPVIAGAAGATASLRTGDTVEMDGTTGGIDVHAS